MRPTVLLAALAAVVVATAASEGCDPPRRAAPRPTMYLAVVSTTSGRIVERWPEPQLLFDVAVDTVTGRVWGVAESGGPYIGGPNGNHPPKVWELFRDKPPEERFELPIVPNQDSWYVAVGMLNFWLDTGFIALDPVHRRGMFTSPSTPVHVLLNLDTGEPVGGISSNVYSKGGAMDVTNGIGFIAGGFGPISSYYDNQSTVSILQDYICTANPGDPPHYLWTGLAYSAANQKLYAADPQYWSPGDIDKGQLCTYDAVTGSAHLETITCDAPGDSQYCDPAGLAVSGDGHRLYIATPDWLNPHPNPSFVIKDLVADTQTVVVDNAFPDGFALSPDDTTLYVTGLACNRIGVYDARTGDHLYDVPMDGFTMGIDLSADGKHLYVAQTDTASYFQQSHTGESGFISYVTDQVIYYYPCPPIVPKPRTLPTPVLAP